MLRTQQQRSDALEKYLVMAGLAVASALVTPKLLQSQLDTLEKSAAQPAVVQQSRDETATGAKTKRADNPLDGRKARIAMDNRGHFMVEARMNGRKANVLIDTGATYVAINESTARKLGIRLKDADFKYKVRTANGITFAAAAMIDEIEIGRVRVKNVRASVSRDASLSTALLGMAFLKKLKKFEISNGELLLTQ